MRVSAAMRGGGHVTFHFPNFKGGIRASLWLPFIKKNFKMNALAVQHLHL